MADVFAVIGQPPGDYSSPVEFRPMPRIAESIGEPRPIPPAGTMETWYWDTHQVAVTLDHDGRVVGAILSDSPRPPTVFERLHSWLGL